VSGFSERRGAHRPAGLGPSSAVPWLIAAVAIIVIVAVGSGWWRGSGEPTSSTVTAGATSGAKSSKTAPATKATTPAASSSPTQAAQADRTLAVTVLNSTSTGGLAAKAAATLKGAGWSIRATGNYRGAVTGTTVFYGRASLRATAEAVAADLGLGTPSESADFGPSRVTVVLAGDYRP
jgi:hypothetical protein